MSWVDYDSLRVNLGTRRVVAAVTFLAAAGVGLGFWFWPRPVPHEVDYKMPGNPGPKIHAAQAAAFERRERVIAQTVWAKEMEAQKYGRVFEDFWDSINSATNKWREVERFGFTRITLGRWDVSEPVGHGIERWSGKGSPQVVSTGDWLERVRRWEAAGWGIMQCEFRHNAFDPQTNDVPAKSRFYFAAHLTNAAPARGIVEGDIIVHWMPRGAEDGAGIQEIDASDLQVLVQPGSPGFSELFSKCFDPPDLTPSIEPLLVYDLDNDGIPEIVLPALNRLYRRGPDGYKEEKFCSTPRLQILNGLFGDFDGDGVTDFLYTEFDGLFLLVGLPKGRFESAPRLVAGNLEALMSPRAVTSGDIDGDGDLDVFVGQFKGPFVLGSMPTPYHDANDGFPSYLFLNDGRGNLKEISDERGIRTKRFRRVYAASFVDLDGDGALDLVVTSDFAGVDIYRNDGRGFFSDVTEAWVEEPHLFGMGHAFGDFDNDGKLDFYVTGMTSPTADRLEHLGLVRANSRLDGTMRAKMSFGSRLYLQADGRFSGGLPGRSVARSGWAWGAGAADIDNDGWLDLYVANGMESMKKVRDYEGELWLHDMFVGVARGNEGTSLYFAIKGRARQNAWESFGGFDKNRFYLNRDGTNFLSAGHLFGLAFEDDCRNLVATDLDADGRVDVVLISQHAGLKPQEKLRVLGNCLPDAGNWIAFEFREEKGRPSPVGVQVRLRAGGRKMVGALVNGDSFRSQHPASVRFGLGKIAAVEEVEIHWPGGAVTRLAGPEINRAHRSDARSSF